MVSIRNLLSFFFTVCTVSLCAHAQSANEILRTTVDNELKISAADHSIWRYRDHNREHNVETVALVVETHQGAVRKTLTRNGRPLTAEQAAEDQRKMQEFLHSPELQSKQKKDGQQDDARATKMLQLLPKAFIWTIQSQQDDRVTLHFTPDPNFHAPDRESRVLAAMEGEFIVHMPDHRMESIRGTLRDDVTFGFGIFGRLQKGGTFNVIRREVAPGSWEVTETHVHMQGHALLFKSISEQEDDVHTAVAAIPETTSLDDAVAILQNDSASTVSQVNR